MDFVNGGSVKDYVEAQDPVSPPSPVTVMKILLGSAKGMQYLHAREPVPILHRDIKSENILITDQFEPRLADFGEARTIAKDHAMTIVSLKRSELSVIVRQNHNHTLLKIRFCSP